MALTEEQLRALEALESMDDLARMDTGVEPIGPCKVLREFIESPIAQPASATTGWDAEFLAKRLGRVAKLAGVSIPERFTHEQVAEAAGTILGQIAAAMEAKTASAPSEQKPVAEIVPMTQEQIWEAFQNNGFGKARALTYSDAHSFSKFRQGIRAAEAHHSKHATPQPDYKEQRDVFLEALQDALSLIESLEWSNNKWAQCCPVCCGKSPEYYENRCKVGHEEDCELSEKIASVRAAIASVKGGETLLESRHEMTTLSKEDVDLAAEKFDYSGFSDEFRTSADGLHAFADHIATLARADLVAENGLTKLALSQKIELLKSCEQALGKSYAENERLKEMVSIANKGKKENLTECLQLTDQLTATRTALAAAEAREGKLRAAIDVVLSDTEGCEDHDGWLANLVSCEAIHQLDEAFSQPRDYSAMREMIAGVYEECEQVCDAQGEEWDSDSVLTHKNYAAFCADAIRALAEKKLAPLTS